MTSWRAWRIKRARIAALKALQKGDLKNLKARVQSCPETVTTPLQVPGCGFDSLLHAALSYEFDKAIPALVAAGADVNEPTKSGSLLMVAARVIPVHLPSIRALLRAGADATQDHPIAETSDPDAIVALLDAGADINGANKRGERPIDLAVALTDPDLTRLLIALGCSILPPDNAQGTMLHRAVQRRVTAPFCDNDEHIVPIVRVLLEAGLAADAQDLDGRTAADIATERQLVEVAGVLRDAEGAE